MAINQTITIKRYGNRRLYNPGAARYVSLDDLAEMVDDERELVVTDAASGEDITRSVLQQIVRARHG
jgi:polyhydroxyalkanoate synthesis repressor PhaR